MPDKQEVMIYVKVFVLLFVFVSAVCWLLISDGQHMRERNTEIMSIEARKTIIFQKINEDLNEDSDQGDEHESP